MDSVDKKIKEIWLDQEESLPADFAWESMQEGILEKMPKQSKKRRAIYWIWAALALMVLAGLAYYMIQEKNQESEQSTKHIAQQGTKSINKTVAPSKTTSTIATASAHINAEEKSTATTEIPRNNKTSTSGNINSEIPNKPSKQLAINNEVTTQSSSAINNKPHSVSTDIIRAVTNVFTEINTSEDYSQKTNLSLATSAIKPTLAHVASLSACKLDLVTHRDLPSITTEYQDQISPEKKEYEHSISFLAGSNWHNGLAHNSASEEYTDGLPGISLGLQYQSIKNNKWFYGAQLNYDYHVDQLDFTKTDTVSHTFTNSTVNIINTLTSSTSQFTGDITQNVPRYRKEYHSNTYQRYGLSLMLGRRFSISKNLHLDIAPRLAYNYLSPINAKGLDSKNEIVDITTDDIGQNHWMLGGMTQLHYGLSDRLKATALGQWSMALNNISEQSNHKSQKLALLAGLSYEF